MYKVLGSPDPRCDWHAPAKVIQSEFPKQFADSYKFAFVRNPWDRMVSLFAFIIEREECKTNMVGTYRPFTHTPEDFLFWLLNYDDSGPRKAYQKQGLWFGQNANWEVTKRSCVKPQLEYITNDSGEIIVDDVGRFETINADFARCCEKAGIGASNLPLVRKGKYVGDYRNLYSDESRKFVEDHFAWDIETFRYEF